MKYAMIGNVKVPSIAMGTWSWGTGVNGGNLIFGNDLHEKELRPIFDRAMEYGFYLWDTAAVYGMGAAETILGSYLAQCQQPVFLSTKFTPNDTMEDSALEETAKKSLERLGIPSFDLYWIHKPVDVERWTKLLIPLVKNGIIKQVGMSNHNLREIKLAQSILNDAGIPLSAVQNHYSLLYRSSEKAGIIDWCNQNNVAFFSYMVLEQGALGGKYSASNPLPKGTRRGDAFGIDELKAIEPLVALQREIGEKYKAGPGEIALAWTLCKQTLPLIGVTKVHHVDGAAQAMEINLTQEEMRALEQAAEKTGISIAGFWEKDMCEE